MTGFDALDLLAEIEDVGRDRRRGGYTRHVFDDAERELRDWFVERAQRLGPVSYTHLTLPTICSV